MCAWLRVGASGLVVVAMLGCGGERAGEGSDRLNGMVALQDAGQPVFGLYAPRAAPRRGQGAPLPDPSELKTPSELAHETMGYAASDYVFNSSMERGVEQGLPAFQDFMDAMLESGASARTHPLVVKMEKISEDPDFAAHIGQQLNAGVSSIMFVHVESAEELRDGLAAMRFEVNGGTRSRDVGSAPAYWGMSEEEYRESADLWPLDPDGELINWTIIESLEGLENIREIASVRGIGVLWPGAGTLRGVFSTTGSDGQRVLDEEAWENAIQKVLSACKEFDIACGYPASPDDIEMRMEQGFSVFVMNWGESGFETIDLGRRAAGR